MLAQFILLLRESGVPASLTEYLALLDAMQAGVCGFDVEAFYHLGRTVLVKDERHYDRYDRVFGACFRGIETQAGPEPRTLPEDWLRRMAERLLTDEEKQRIEALGGFEALMRALQERLAEQHKRHQGGTRMIGTAGTSPFGAYGFNPEGVRIGQEEGRHRRAVKIWDQRAFRDLDDTGALDNRSMKLALRRLRRFAREGSATELDMDGTVHATAGNAGHLDLRLRAQRRNAMKILLLFDIGGSMDEHVRRCESLFAAARSEFRQMDWFYFHNCPYERVWRSNTRRDQNSVPTEQLMRTYGADTRLIMVGDASMSPYELSHAGGSVEHWNAESGEHWLSRLFRHYRRVAWINPVRPEDWDRTQSLRTIRTLLEDRMYPLTLDGLARMTAALAR